eukprot:g18624.t1
MTLVVSGKAKFTQAQGCLDHSLFQEYDCVEGAKFGINLTTLLECLQIFGPSSLAQTSVSMAYQEARATFRLTLEEGGVFTSCEIRTIHQDEDAMEFSALAKAFGNTDEVCRCILKSEILKEAFQELADLNGATTVSVTFGQEAPHLQLSAKGSIGSSEIDFPKSSEAFVTFTCHAPRVSWTYLMSGMETGMRALPHANETYFRVNEEGILCIQHQVPMSMGQTSFVDVLLCPDMQDVDMDMDVDMEEEQEGRGEDSSSNHQQQQSPTSGTSAAYRAISGEMGKGRTADMAMNAASWCSSVSRAVTTIIQEREEVVRRGLYPKAVRPDICISLVTWGIYGIEIKRLAPCQCDSVTNALLSAGPTWLRTFGPKKATIPVVPVFLAWLDAHQKATMAYSADELWASVPAEALDDGERGSVLRVEPDHLVYSCGAMFRDYLQSLHERNGDTISAHFLSSLHSSRPHTTGMTRAMQQLVGGTRGPEGMRC